MRYDAPAKRVLLAGASTPNRDVLPMIAAGDYDMLAIEYLASYGKTIGAETLDTAVWIGRFIQASWYPDDAARVKRILRRTVKSRMGLVPQATDSVVRQHLIDQIGPPGTKAKPGPTYGVTKHAWQALAVAYVAT